MTSKRQKARAALLEWKAKITPEMFVEEHKGIVFAETDKSPKLEISNEATSILSAITDRFLSLWVQQNPVKHERSFNLKHRNHYLFNLPYPSFEFESERLSKVDSDSDSDSLTEVFETLTYQEHIRPISEELSSKGYDGILNNVNKNPLRLI